VDLRCRPDVEEIAEAYALHHLSPEDADHFEAHYLVCPACARIAEREAEFVRVMRAALAEYRRKRAAPAN
jgi:hypothetical protein